MLFKRYNNHLQALIAFQELPYWGGDKLAAILQMIFQINPLRAKFFRGNINIYLHFVSFLHIDPTQVVEILPQIRQEPTYST